MNPAPTAITTMRLPLDLLEALIALAKRRGMNRTQLVRHELAAVVKREQAEKPAPDADPFA